MSDVSATAMAAAAVSTTSTASTTTYTSTTTNYNLGALTTTWTPPSDCFHQWLGCSGCGYAEILQTCYDGGSELQNNPTCFPSITLTPSTSSSDYYMEYSTYGYYSPGIACPSGFTAACAMQGGTNGVASAVSGSQQYDFSFTPSVSETAVGCCPTGYACAGGNSCTQIFAETTLELLQCTTGAQGPTVTTTFSLPQTPVETEYETDIWSTTSTATSTYYYTETFTQMTMYAPIYQLMYQATDLPKSTSTSSSASSISDSTSIPAASTSASSSHKSNTGTIAAAVTVPVVVIALAAAGFGWWWWRRRRARQQVAYEPAQPNSPGPIGPVEMSEQTIPWEMPATDARIELPGGAGATKPEGPPEGIVHEMDAGGHN